MSDQISFELASPQKMAFAKPVAMVVVPGSEGRYGVLSGHAPMATAIGPGVVEIYENDQQSITAKFFVTGGFCQVASDGCALIADQVIQMKELVRADIEKQIKALLAEAKVSRSEEDRMKIESLIFVERAKLAVAA